MAGRGTGIHTRLSSTEGTSASQTRNCGDGKKQRFFRRGDGLGGGLGDLERFLSRSLFYCIKLKHRTCGPSSCSAHSRERRGQLGRRLGQGARVGPAHKRCQVQARCSASGERLVECHPLRHRNLPLSLSALPLTLLGFCHPIPLPIYILPLPLKHLSILPQKTDEQRPCPASFSSCSLFPLRWSLLLLYFSLAVLALSPSANPSCEQAVLGVHGGENPAGDDKIHRLGNFYP